MSPTESYLSFFSQFTEFSPMTALSLFFLGMMRLAPIIGIAPFFGSKTPSPMKMGLLIALTTIFFPKIVATTQTMVFFDTNFILLCGKEFLIGLFLAIFVSVPFFMVESAGVYIDFLRGSSSLQVTDPVTQSQGSSIGVLYNYVMIVLFYQIDGPFYFYNAFFDSYGIIPADSMLPIDLFQFQHPLWETVWGLANRIVSVGIQLSAPSLLAILMTEMFLGIANRLAPQVQIAFLGMSLKSLVGLGMLCAAWFFILQQAAKQNLLWLNKLSELIQTLNQ